MITLAALFYSIALIADTDKDVEIPPGTMLLAASVDAIAWIALATTLGGLA